MDGNQQQPSQPVGPLNIQGPTLPAAPISQPMMTPNGQAVPTAPTPTNGYVGANPLQPQAPAQPPVAAMPPQPQPAPPAFTSPLQPGVGAMPPAMPQPPMSPQPNMPAVNLDDDGQVSVDDAVWINRAKRAIAESKGDPHRQTQLIQNLRAQYLKQRFNRSVHTDEA